MLHTRLTQKRHVGWRSLALGIGLGMGLSEIVRRLVARMGWPVPWWRAAGHATETPVPSRSSWTPPLESRSTDVSLPSNVAPFRSPQVPTTTEAPLPELPEDVGSEAPVHAESSTGTEGQVERWAPGERIVESTTERLQPVEPSTAELRAVEATANAGHDAPRPARGQTRRSGATQTIRSSTPEEIRTMDSESIHNEQARQEVPSDPSLPKDLRPMMANDEDIHRIAIETLRANPQASLDDVMSAWHVHRGVTIDAEEAQRVTSIYGRLNETYEVA
jgi:hypothetical protein